MVITMLSLRLFSGQQLLFVVVTLLHLFQPADGNEVVEYISSLCDLVTGMGDSLMDWQDRNTMERLERMWEDHCRIIAVLAAIVQARQGYDNLRVKLVEIYIKMVNVLQFFQRHLESLNTERHFQAGLVVTGESGRPRYDISKEQIEQLRATGMQWNEIADCLNVPIITLYRHRVRLGISMERYTHIDDNSLDQHILEILQLTPEVGETYVIGALRGRGITVKRSRIRERLNVLDPVSRDIRRRLPILRRTYDVTVPNKLWHMDSNHKLIAWRFVIHGCIDGASRCIIYLKVATNNTASQVLHYFQQGCRDFNIPSRVRGDHGTENVDVARFMIAARGAGRGSFITGRSVHNQRIERLWRDTNRVVSKQFKEIFQDMENADILSQLDEVDLFCLHMVFLPRIQKSLDAFVSLHNHHGLRTEGNRSPLDLWYQGVYEHLDVVEDIADPEIYGIDYEGPVPPIQTNNNVEVPDVILDLPEALLTELSDFNAFEDDGNFGIDVYVGLRNHIRENI